MRIVLLHCLLWVTMLLGTAPYSWSAIGNPEREAIVQEGIAKLRQQQTRNAWNTAHHLADQNTYLIVLGDKKPDLFSLKENIGNDVISEKDAIALNQRLRALSQKGVETYLLLVNYLPIPIAREIPADATIKSILEYSPYAADNSKKDIEKANQDFDRMWEEIFQQSLNNNGKQFYCGLGNYYAVYGGKQAKRYSTCRSTPNASVTNALKEIWSKQLPTVSWKGTNAQRAAAMVTVLEKAVTEYIAGKPLSDYAQQVLTYFKTVRPRTYETNQEQVDRIVRYISEMGNLYPSYVEASKAQVYSGVDAATYADQIWAIHADILDKFENSLKAYTVDIANARTLLKATSDNESRLNENVAILLKGKGLGNLTLAERIHLLKELSKGGLYDNFLVGHKTERYVLELLRTTPPSDQNAILESLLVPFEASKEYDYPLGRLAEGLGGENAWQFGSVLDSWLAARKPSKEGWKPILASQAKPAFLVFNSDVMSSYEERFEQKNKIYFGHKETLTFPVKDYDFRQGAYEPVLVKFIHDFQIGSTTFTAGSLVQMPAVLVYLILNEKEVQNAVFLGKATLYTSLVVLTAGQVVAAETGLQLTLALLDGGLLASDMALQAGLAEKLAKTQEGQQYLDAWNKIMLLYGGARLYSELFGLRQALDDALAKLPKEQQVALKESHQSTLQQIDETATEAPASTKPLGEVAKQATTGKAGVNSLFVQLEASELSRLGVIMPKDGFIDLMIHFENGRYVLYLEKTGGGLARVELQAEELISLIRQSLQQAGYTDKTIPLRFLSCSDKAAGSIIAAGLDHPMYVTDGLVRMHGDGGITAVARSGNAAQKWYRLEQQEDKLTKQITIREVEVPAPKAPKAAFQDDFVQMGRKASNVVDETTFVKALTNRGLSNSDAENVYLLLIYSQDNLATDLPLLECLLKIIPNQNYKNPENLLAEISKWVDGEGNVIDQAQVGKLFRRGQSNGGDDADTNWCYEYFLLRVSGFSLGRPPAIRQHNRAARKLDH